MMEAPDEIDKEYRYYQAKVLVHFYCDEAIDLLTDGGDPRMVRRILERRFHKNNQQYFDIMRLVKENDMEGIAHRLGVSDTASHKGSSARSLPPSTPPVPSYVPLNIQTQVQPPSPALTHMTAQSQGSSPEIIKVLGENEQDLSMMQSSAHRNFIRADLVSQRLSSVHRQPCHDFHGRHSNAYGGPYPHQVVPYPHQVVKLTFWRRNSPCFKTHEESFCIDETLSVADVLVDYSIFNGAPPQVTIPPSHSEVPGGPPQMQAFLNNPSPPGDSLRLREFAYPHAPSVHQSSIAAKTFYNPMHNGPPSMISDAQSVRYSPEIRHQYSSMGSTPKTAIPADYHQAPAPAYPVDAVSSREPAPSSGQPSSSSSASKVSAKYTWGSRSATGRFELCHQGTSFLDELRKACRPLKLKLDRSVHSVVLMADSDEHAMVLDEASFLDDWPDMRDFVQSNRSVRADKKAEFVVKIERLDDFD